MTQRTSKEIGHKNESGGLSMEEPVVPMTESAEVLFLLAWSPVGSGIEMV